MATDPYVYWRAMLAHKADPKLPLPDFSVHHAETGFYRGTRDNSATAIWWRNDAQERPVQCLAQVHRPSRTGGKVAVSNYDKADVISENLFSYCCRNPITHEAYKEFVKTGVWPEDVNLPKPTPPRREGSREYFAEDRADAQQAREIEEKLSASPIMENESRPVEGTHVVDETTSPEQAFSTEINVVISEAEAYLNQIGRKIEVAEHANKIANYSIASAAIATRAEAARVAQKRPILEAGRAIDALWNPIVARSEKVTKNLKTLLVPYFNKQREKAAQEAADAQKAREASTLAGEVPPLAGARPSPTTAGTMGRISLKGQKIYRITDLRAAAAFVAALNDPPEPFLEGVLSSARALMKAGVEVPGVEVKIEDTVA